MDLALNSLKRLICHENQTKKQTSRYTTVNLEFQKPLKYEAEDLLKKESTNIGRSSLASFYEGTHQSGQTSKDLY